MNIRVMQEANGAFYAACYAEGVRQGSARRSYLLANGLSLETMHNNHYRGTTFRGLYGYMAAMGGA